MSLISQEGDSEMVRTAGIINRRLARNRWILRCDTVLRTIVLHEAVLGPWMIYK